MNSVEQFVNTRVMLAKTPCPACSEHSLELRLFCDRGGSCSNVAVCDKCGIKLEVQVAAFAPQLAHLLSDLTCPDCGNQAADFAMSCELPSRSCDPSIVCIVCGHAYVDRAAAIAPVLHLPVGRAIRSAPLA